ncbi:hypothetical protein HIM_06107 [Hirsutella minnesotensis 3608]|uniref:DUF7907 domain-containing protein n=1 Tax=Hirsutella minnesotensis 3608 TaxID=1043627 RepID=A0A0F7ZJL1_9HYPO|nr:hypothetical protein HIM_06107 [Hirsutella minnesotensis 3608]
MKPDTLFFIAANLLAAVAAVPQLLVPSIKPVLTDNFRLAAHAIRTSKTYFTRPIEGWQVVSCRANFAGQKSLVLVPSTRNSTSTPTSFYFNPHSLSIQSEQGKHQDGLVLTMGRGRWVLKLARVSKGTSKLGVLAQPDGPQLAYQNGSFYTCQPRKSREADLEIYWREHGKTLDKHCVDVALFSVPTSGPARETPVVACKDVREGMCIYPLSAGPRGDEESEETAS